MRLSRIIIKNFRCIEEADIHLAKSTFLIGQNNCGKSSVIRCLELLLSTQPMEAGDFRKEADGSSCEAVELTSFFAGIAAELANSRGFRGRVMNGEYCYRKTYSLTNPGKPKVECREYPYTVRPEFAAVKTGEALVAAGIPEERVREIAGEERFRGHNAFSRSGAKQLLGVRETDAFQRLRVSRPRGRGVAGVKVASRDLAARLNSFSRKWYHCDS